jgi:16S rRNA (cytosine967-C5)-methyltransferase
VLYRARPAIIAQNAALQSRLLERASHWLKPGGSLVYSVCSLEPQEGEDVIEAFLASHDDFKLGEPESSPLVGEVGRGPAASAAEKTLLSASPARADDAPPPNPPHEGERFPGFARPTEDGWVRILPGLLERQGGLDGFFIARLVRRG